MQQSFVVGHMDVQPKASNILPEDAEPEDHIEHHSAETQCLSRTKLKHVAESILENSTLKVSWDFAVHFSTSDQQATALLMPFSSRKSAMCPAQH